MRVVVRVIAIDGRRARVLEEIRRVQAMIDERAAGGRRRRLAVAHEAVGAVDECAGFPRVVGRRGAKDYGRAFGLEESRGVFFVGGVCEDGFGNAAEEGRLALDIGGARGGEGRHHRIEVMGCCNSPVSGLAGSGIVRANGGAICAAVVCGSQTTTVVVAEFNDDEVAGLNLRCHGGKAALARKATSRPPCNRVVDDRDIHVVC